MKLHLIAKVVLVLWLARNFVVFFLPTGGLIGLAAFVGGTLGDLRVWMLVIGLVALRYRFKEEVNVRRDVHEIHWRFLL